MANLAEMKTHRMEAIQKAESIVAAAENAGRALTENENSELDTAMNAVQGLNSRIEATERVATMIPKLREALNGGIVPGSTEPGAKAFLLQV